MARLIGIDLRSNIIRVAVLRTTYRNVVLEALVQAETKSSEGLEDALRQAVLPLLHPGDATAVSLEGERAFVRRVSLPANAAKQLDEVLPFELEALLPVEFSELVFDYRKLTGRSETGEIETLTAAARKSDVEARIQLIENALGRQPERVGAGPLPLANLVPLVPELASPGPVGLVDFGPYTTDVLILKAGIPVYARTASMGIAGLPQSASRLIGVLRQTFGGFVAQGGEAISKIYLTGGGATAPGAVAYLTHELDLHAEVLPKLVLETRSREFGEQTAQYAKAIAIALGLRSQPRDLDLRQDELAFQRGYGFIKQKAPLIASALAMFIVSFVLSTWAESRALARENTVLASALEQLTEIVTGEPTRHPSTASELLDRGGGPLETDPRPRVDAFDVLVGLAEAVPEGVVHDVDELDMARGQVKVAAVVGTTKEAETIAENFKQRPCFQNVKITRITQAVNSERQKYVMEFETKCETTETSKASSSESSSAQARER